MAKRRAFALGVEGLGAGSAHFCPPVEKRLRVWQSWVEFEASVALRSEVPPSPVADLCVCAEARPPKIRP